MFGKNKKKQAKQAAKDINEKLQEQEKQEKPTPAFLRDDYPYKAIGEPITDLDSLKPTGVLYEIKCPKCEMSIRSQGVNIKPTYERMMNGVEVTDDDGTTRIEGGKGCIGCGNRELIIREVDMSRMAEVCAARENETASGKEDN